MTQDVSSAPDAVSPEGWRGLAVAERRMLAQDVVGLTLVDPAGAALPPWAPGAHLDLLVGEDVIRQYSLCGSPGDRGSWRIGVLLDRTGRGGSRHVHDVMHPGTPVRVRGPRNSFPMMSSDAYVFVAGGIGITPLLPMVAAAAAAGAEWTVHYGGRTRAAMAFVDELLALGGRVSLWPQDERGMLDVRAILGEPRPHTLVYACGPEGLLSAVEEHAGRWPQGSVHVERFSPRPQDPVVGSGSFDVVCQRSKIVLTVPPDRTILEAVVASGISAMSSCREGVCGTCETRVLAGVPEHRDSLLTAAERARGDYLMICVSRSLTPRIVLDL